MVMTYDEYLKKNKKKKKEEPKVVLGYSNKQNVNNSPKSTTNTQTLIDKYVAEQKAKKDIAPVRTTVTTPKKPAERTWFQAGAFSDGYDFGDVAKTITGTTADVGLGAVKGIFNLSEGIVDLGRYGVSGVANILGAKEYAKDVKKTAQENTTEKWFSPIEKKIDKNSLIGEKGDTISEGLGYVASMIATGGVGGAIGGAVSGGAKAVQIGATLATTGTTFTSAMGSGMSEAYEGGASDEEAVTYGVISGIAEAGTELIFGGLGRGINAVGLNTGLSQADDMLAKKVSEVFKNQVAKNIAETGIKMGAEGTEEVIAGIIQAFGQKVTYKSEEELMQIINDQELLESFISGAVVSGIAQAPSVIKDTKAGRDYVTGYTQQEQQAIDKVVNERITEQERQGITLTKKEKNAIIEQTTKEFNEFKKKVKEIAPVKDDVRSQDIAPVKQAGTQDAPVNERQQNYVSEAKETDSVYRKNLNEDASKYANNSKRTHEFVNTLSNISEATGENIRLTNNTSEEMVARRNQLIERYAKKKNISVEEATTKLKDTVIDAYNTGDGITINVNSPKALNRLVGHEITHSLEKTTEYNGKLQKIAIEYAKTKGEYDSRVEILESLYDGTNANIQNELTSDIVGDYLFTDQEFINNIQKKDRNLFQRIYDEIKHLIKLVTANTKEAKQLEQLKHSFEKAMAEHKSDKTNKVTVQETKSNSPVEVEGNTQEKEETVQKVEEEFSLSQDNKGRELSEEQIEFFKDSKVRDKDGKLLTMYHGTRADFYVFDKDRAGQNYEDNWSRAGRGNYFTPDEKVAKDYGEASVENAPVQIKEVYLNITNPFDMSTDYSETLSDMKAEYNIDDFYLKAGYRLIDWFRDQKIDSTEVLQKYGFDGIHDFDDYITFESNQIKEVTNKKPTLDDDIRYSLSTVDNEGKELSKEQVEFFKDSKIRDSQGRLMVAYHSTSSESEFFVFNKEKIGSGNGGASFGKGFYFATYEDLASDYGEPKAYYLNIKNPFNYYSTDKKYIVDMLEKSGYDYDKNFVNSFDFDTLYDVDFIDDFLYEALKGQNPYNEFSKMVQNAGFDGVMAGSEIVAFEPNQIKNVDNTNPTDSDDIRYSLTKASDEQVKQATKLESQDKTQEEIYLETGAYRGADGKWRTEIDDSRAYIKTSSTMIGGKYKLNEILSFPKLYKAYPEFKNMTVVFDDNMLPGNLGSYNPDTNILTINSSIYDYDQAELLSAKKQLADWDNTVKTYEVLFSGEQIEQQLETLKKKAKQYKRKDYQKELKSTLLHELQHVIQETEGFTSGANPSYWQRKQDIAETYRDAYRERENELYKKMEMDKFFDDMWGKVQDMTWEEFQQAKEDYIDNSEYSQEYRDLQEIKEKNAKRYEILTGRSAYELYRDTAGEQEARNVQERMDMSKKQRKETMPFAGNRETVFYEGSYNEEKYGVFLNQTDDNDIRYSLSDNKDRELSKKQQEYFKNSKVRDENGKLLTMYHGGYATTEFTRGNGEHGPGYYFTPDYNYAESYGNDDGKTVTETYLKIEKPLEQLNDKNAKELSKFINFVSNTYNIPKDNVTKMMSEYDWTALIGEQVALKEGYSYQDVAGFLGWDINDVDPDDVGMKAYLSAYAWQDVLNQKARELGYDGIISRVYNDDTDFEEYIAFNSNQIKSVDNTNPTDDADIRYSLSMDNQGNELKPAVQKWAENSKARDENGQLKVLYHGSPMGEFTVFNKNMASPEGDWGAGFYLTDNEYDVETNYADGGGDFDNKVEKLAEQLASEDEYDAMEVEDSAYQWFLYQEKAREQLYKGYYRIDAYAKIENPAIVGKTYLFSDYHDNYNIEDFETEEEYYEAVDQLVADDIDSVIWEIENTYDFYNGTDDIRNVLWEGYANGGIEIQELKDKLNELYLETDEGLVSNDVARIIIESLGYDGIIDNTVSGKFKGMHLNEGTTHYIVFKPNQIKNISNENPTDNPDIRYSLSKSSDELTRQAQEYYGTTDDFDIGAYMTPDGKLLDFGTYINGYRKDHSHISDIGYSIQEFVDAGNIRMKPEANGFEMTQEPTKEQYDTLRTYIYYIEESVLTKDDEYINVDINKEFPRYDSAVYKVGTPPSKIINDIKEYYRTGSFPKQSEYAEFMYSLSRTTDDIAPVKDADVFGRDIALQEAIAPLQEQVKELTKAITDLQENIAPASMDLVNEEGHRRLQEMTDEDAPVDEGLFTFLDNEVQVKKKQEIVNEIASDFSIKKTEARELYNKIYSIPEPTIEDVRAELEAYREIKFQEEDDYVKSIQDYIKGTRLDISEIKKQIPDYGNKYRMSNMGKGLILGNSGLKIDSFYQELSELYPNEFPATVTAEADQLELISDAMYREKELTYTDRIDDDELQILAQRIYSDIGNHERYRHTQSGLYFLNKELKNMTPPGEADNDIPVASNTKQTGDIAPVSRKLKQLNPEATVSETPVTEGTKITKSKWRNAVDTTQRLFVNEMVETDNLAKETGNLNIKYKGDMLNSVAGEIEGEIQIAQTDNEGHAIGKSLSELFAPAKEKGLYDAFNDYLEHYSNIDRHAQGKGSKTPLNVSQTLVKAYEKSYPEFKQWGKDVWQYGANVRQNLIDAGIISEEQAEALGTMYPHYVPYMENREMSNYNPDLGEIKPKGVIKRAKGGAKNLLPIEEALTKYTFAYKKAVRQNQFYQEIIKTLGPGVDVGADVRNDAIDFDDTLYKDETGNYLTAYVNGERVSARISDDMYEGLRNDLSKQIKNLEEKFELITKPVQKLSEIRRNLLTSWSPMFIIKNPIMDVQDALFNSKHTTGFIKNYFKAFVELWKANTETARQFLTLYGSGNVMGEHSADGTVKKSNFLKGIQRLNNVMELAPRYAEFKASLENGASIQEAMYNAREVTTNFSRGGTITKALNKNGFTFLNVSVQGFDKFIRNFSGENGAKGFAGALLKATLLGVAPALFNDLLFGGDDEDEEYEALPDYIKDNYYLFKTGEGEFIRIPKGRMLSVFGSAGRRTLEFMQGEEDAFEGFLKNANSQVGISNPLDSNILTPLIQAYGSENGEAWFGGDLVPSRLQKKAPEEQYDATTDKMSIWLGDKLGISPYKLNYVLDQYSGGIGDIFLPFITEESTSDAEGLGMVLAPIKDQFTANSTSDNKYAGEIYDLSDKMDKMPEATKETDEYKVQDAYLYSVTSEMGKLYEERRNVQADKDLSKSEKYKKVQAIQKQINDLAKEGMENYQNVSKTDVYAIVGGREFNKYTTDDGTERWGSVFEDVLEDLNSLGMDLDEKSEYFRATSTISTIQDNYKNLLESASDEEQDVLYAERKKEIINIVKEKNLTGEQKAYLYDKYYGNSDVVEAMVNLNVDIDSFLDYEAQNFTADKYANGKTVPNSKKRKVFEYINSMPIEFEQRLVLAKLQYPSYNEYNPTIINYLNNSEMTYEQVETLLTKMNFKVDENGNIRW